MKNRSRVLSRVCILFSLLLLAFMAVQLFLGYQDYLLHPEASAPFYLYGIVIALPYLPLSLVGFTAAHLLRQKN